MSESDLVPRYTVVFSIMKFFALNERVPCQITIVTAKLGVYSSTSANSFGVVRV
jgi:hypothetical protein